MRKTIVGKNIYKAYDVGKEKVEILENISIVIYEGEFITIMGPSGSGKSTLLYMLNGIDTVDSGEIHFREKRMDTCNEKELADLRRQQMGLVFQQPTFLKILTLIDNIILPATKDWQGSKHELLKKAKELLKKTKITHLANRMTNQVSGGQLQRAGICRALVNNPTVVFADEPTGALNSKSAEEIMDILLQINREGTTILQVTHDARNAAQSERVLFMKDGKIVDEVYLGKFVNQTLENRIEEVTRKMLQIEI